MNKISNKQALIYLGHIFFLIYIAFACIFYKERVIYADSAFHLFKIIQFKSFVFEANRYSTVLVQTIPLLGIYLGLSLKYVILLYSLSFPVIFYLCYIFIVHLLKDIVSGVLLLIPLVIGLRYAYFYSITETHQALVYCTVFFAWINSRFYSKKLIYFLVGSLFVLLCLFSHPVAVFVLVFIVFYTVVNNSSLRFNSLWIFGAIIVLFFVLKLLFTAEGSYEGIFISQLKNPTQSIARLYILNPLKFLITRSLNTYLLSFVLFVSGSIYLYRAKSMKQLYTDIAALLILFLITVLTYSKGDSNAQMEKDFMPVMYVSSFPFLYFITCDKTLVYRKLLLFASILIAGFILIYITGKTYYNQRLNTMNQLLEVSQLNSGQKLILDEKNIDEFIGVSWAFPFETLLYSSIESPGNSKTIFVDKDNLNLSDTSSPTCFLGAPFWLIWNTEEMDSVYFKIKPGNYIYLNTQEISKTPKFNN